MQEQAPVRERLRHSPRRFVEPLERLLAHEAARELRTSSSSSTPGSSLPG
jgi:hypothetical protein